MSEEILARIDRRLEQLVKISALNVGKDSTLTDRIVLLYKIDFGPKEIAEILGTNPNVVNVRLSEARKRGEIK
ncbi:MAG: hypothetical protein WC607_02230 [Candidatus Micrarchaeia archaeon]